MPWSEVNLLKRIALIPDYDFGFNQDLLRGIAGFSQLARAWSFYSVSVANFDLPRLQEWRPDGIILCASSSDVRDAVCGLPFL